MKALLLSLLLLAGPWPAQEAPALWARVERAFAEKEPRWEVVPQGEGASPHTIHLKSGRFHALITIFVADSPRSAAETFEGHAVSYGNRMGRRGRKTALANFADENAVWAGFDPAGTTIIHFRQGRVYADITAPSRATAERFARLVLAQVAGHGEEPAGPPR